jgi:hypothetical protein
MVFANERRMSPRTPPGALGADILIMNETGMWMSYAKLLDISAGGALIRSDGGMAEGRQLRILVQDVPELGWIDAQIVRVAGPGEAGVRFRIPFCPDFVLSATTERKPERDERAASKTPYLGDAIAIW